jgi:hypothetical protein
MISAFVANLFLAAVIIVLFGADADGSKAALRATARLSFLWFWVAYAGGPLSTLFGSAFIALKRYAREFGLAFAAALVVHLGLVSWLCWIGATPGRGTFVLFGSAATVTFLLAAFSFGNLHAVLGARWWYVFRMVGMNFILYAFFTDFKAVRPLDIDHALTYLPFAVMAVAAPLLRITAWATRLRPNLAASPRPDTEQHHVVRSGRCSAAPGGLRSRFPGTRRTT